MTPTLKLIVASQGVQVFVGAGGKKPSPVPVVTLELLPLNGRPLTVEMTPGQTGGLLLALRAALEAGARPEGT